MLIIINHTDNKLELSFLFNMTKCPDTFQHLDNIGSKMLVLLAKSTHFYLIIQNENLPNHYLNTPRQADEQIHHRRRDYAR